MVLKNAPKKSSPRGWWRISGCFCCWVWCPRECSKMLKSPRGERVYEHYFWPLKNSSPRGWWSIFLLLLCHIDVLWCPLCVFWIFIIKMLKRANPLCQNWPSRSSETRVLTTSLLPWFSECSATLEREANLGKKPKWVFSVLAFSLERECDSRNLMKKEREARS